jgi:hypothetical protein
VSARSTVLIAAQALLAPLRARLAADGSEVLSFSDVDTLQALEAISARRPKVVALERGFASTARGAAFINRIAADPALLGSTVRIIAQDPPPPAPPGVETSPGTADGIDARRVPRYELVERVEAAIDNNAVTLVKLSTLGAEVVSAAVLKPNQRIRLSVSDGATSLRTSGVIIWANFEIPPGSGPRYRAGLEFVNPDVVALDAFIRTRRKT